MQGQLISLQIYEYRRRGIFFGFARVAQPCACGEHSLLLPLPLALSRQPLLDTARRLMGMGHPANSWIEMAHGDATEPALTSTLGAAAKLTVKASETGPPVFVRFREADVREPRPCAIPSQGVEIASTPKNRSARLRLGSTNKRAA
jgi:hypothetical protein